jgi:hypothetical protein
MKIFTQTTASIFLFIKVRKYTSKIQSYFNEPDLCDIDLKKGCSTARDAKVNNDTSVRFLSRQR